MNDKDDKNDKESEKSPMRVIGRGLWKPCHCCHSCHGRWVVLSENSAGNGDVYRPAAMLTVKSEPMEE